MENDGINGQKRGSAQQFTEGIDKLCDLIISRLEERWNGGHAFQAGCREFESRLPLHRYKIIGRAAKMNGLRQAAFSGGRFATTTCLGKNKLWADRKMKGETQ